MAAPSSTIWGNTVNGKGRLGLKFTFAEQSNEPDKVKVTVDIWFWSRYPLEDANNTLYFENLATYAKKVETKGVKIKHTQSGKNGWNTRNQTKIRTVDTFTVKRETTARTYSCAARLGGIDGIDSIPVSANYIIEALPKYNITYDLNGGEGNFSSSSQFYGMNYILPSTVPSKDGLIFQGWKIEGSDGLYSAGSEILIKKEIKLIAQWGENPVVYLAYDANGGTGSIPVQTSADNKFILLKDGAGFSKEGYKFEGWSYDPEGSIINKESITITEPTILYAIWAPLKIKLNFYIQEDDEIKITTKEALPGQSILLDITSDNWFSLNSANVKYKFKNEWYCDYDKKFYREGQLFTVGVATEINFYAQWYDPAASFSLRKDGFIEAASFQEIKDSEIIIDKYGILYANELVEQNNNIYFTNKQNQVKSLCFNELTDLKILNYVSLGDSIAAGQSIRSEDRLTDSNLYPLWQYGGPNNNQSTEIISGSYTDLLRKALVNDSTVVKAKSYAHSGDKVSDLISKLNHSTIQESLKQANIVTICIGANNVLGPAMSHIEGYINGSYSLEQIESDVRVFLNELQNDENINSYLSLFNKLYEINPRAKYIFTTVYNPMKYLYLEQSTAANEYKDGFLGPLMWFDEAFPSWVTSIVDANILRGQLLSTSAVQSLYSRTNAIAPWVEKIIVELNSILKTKIDNFNKPNFILADSKAVFDTVPDRPISIGPGERHYNDLVNIEFTRGFKTDHMDWGRFWQYADWSSIGNDVLNLNLEGVMNQMVSAIVSEVILPDLDPHPEEGGQYILSKAFEDVLGLSSLTEYFIMYRSNINREYRRERILSVDNLPAYVKCLGDIFEHDKVGYKIQNWKDNNDNIYEKDSILKITSDIELFAQWDNKITLTISHRPDAKSLTSSPSDTGRVGCYWYYLDGGPHTLGAFSNPPVVLKREYGSAVGVKVAAFAGPKTNPTIRFYGFYDEEGNPMPNAPYNDTEQAYLYDIVLTSDVDIEFIWCDFGHVDVPILGPQGTAYWDCNVIKK